MKRKGYRPLPQVRDKLNNWADRQDRAQSARHFGRNQKRSCAGTQAPPCQMPVQDPIEASEKPNSNGGFQRFESFDPDERARNKPIVSEKPSPIEIFDASLIRERLRRSEKRGLENFLIPSCIDELIDRLAGIKRRFTRIVDIGTPSELLSWRLTDVFHEARILRLGPIRENELEHGDVSEDLRLEPESRDLAVSVLALQAANDLPGIFAQVRRSLRPDGLFLGCLLGGQSLKELRLSFAAAESELNDGASPRVAPFVDVRDLGGLLQRAGFALPVADIDSITVRYAHPLNLMRDLRAMGATNAMKSRDRRPLKRQILMRACEFYVDNFADPDGRIRATFDIVWLSGWAPDASQQKPARPGSAQMRLADVLPTKYDDDGKR